MALHNQCAKSLYSFFFSDFCDIFFGKIHLVQEAGEGKSNGTFVVVFNG